MKIYQNSHLMNIKNKIDLFSGGFPYQAFSYAGNNLGFEDARRTMFFEFARAIKEINPKVFFDIYKVHIHEKRPCNTQYNT
jgi:site-specific DNA-cytosine methylase